MSGSKLSFFRQSGWLVITTTLSGFLMSLVHPILQKEMPTGAGAFATFLRRVVAPPIAQGEYGDFYTLLLLFGWLGIPAAGLQTVFAQQTALAINDEQRREVAASVRALLKGTFFLWLGSLVAVFFLQGPILSALKMSSAGPLWVTLISGLTALWTPVIMGVMQGKQDFMILGWSTILNAIGRCIGAAVLVRVLGFQAAGALIGVLLGMWIALGMALGKSTEFFCGPAPKFDWRPWLKSVVPLTLGLAASMFMVSADQFAVKAYFTEGEAGRFAAAGVVARALGAFTGPMALVMFPKIVRSAAQSEKTDVMAYALGATALMGGLAALACTLLPELPIRILYNASYLEIASLVPWFAWCFLPLTLANVLINNLLARQHFEVVPWLLVVAVGYGCALMNFHSTFLTVVQTLGTFSLLQLAVATWFTWRRR